MSLGKHLAMLGLQTLAAAVDLAGCEAAGKLGGAVGSLFRDRLGDGSRRLVDALQQATQRSWAALEAALAGDTLRQKLRTLAGRREDRIFAGQVQTFLATVPLGDAHEGEESARRMALAELRHAREAGLLAGGIDGSALEAAADPLIHYARPDDLLDAQEKSLHALAASLQQSGYSYLARVLVVRSPAGQPLLLLALAYFFRRAVEADEQLFRGLALGRLRHLQAGVESGFAALELALDLHAGRVEEMFAETRDAVLDVRSQLVSQNEHLRAIGEAVQDLLEQHRLHRREVRPGDSMTLRDDGERRVVRQLVDRYHALPESDRRGSPALLNAIGKLEVISGDFDGAQRDFQAVATLVEDRSLRAEAHFNAYRAALERREPAIAMSELLAALADDAGRFAPMPLNTFEPQSILGAGGFGVAFLCRHRFMQARIVVKSLWLEPLGLAADQVFTEAHLLRQLDHPGIIRILDCGYVDVARQERPYLVMDYFEGESLELFLMKQQRLPVEDYVAIAREVAAGLQAAHARGILHRDVKPANLLARRDDDRWQVKIIDFGLAMRHQAGRGQETRTTTRQARTLMGHSLAGTLAYAAPEQLAGGDAPIGPPADVYAFGRTSCHLLFGTTHPLPRHWQTIPATLADLLGRCLEEAPADRPADFAEVLAHLGSPVAATGPVVHLAPYRPAIFDAVLVDEEPDPPAPRSPRVGETFDAEVYTSLLELIRLTRRSLRLGLFEIAGDASFPFVVRSEAGGYEAMRSPQRSWEKVHPILELDRLLTEQKRQGREPDGRLKEQMKEMTAQARARLAGTPWVLVRLGSLALTMLGLCPFFGMMIALLPVLTAPFIVFIALTGASGIAAIVLGILSIVSIVQHGHLKRFGSEVITHVEPYLKGQAGIAVSTWPQERAVRRIRILITTVVLLVLGSLAGLAVAVSHR